MSHQQYPAVFYLETFGGPQAAGPGKAEKWMHV